jgi:hypothetical protein
MKSYSQIFSIQFSRFTKLFILIFCLFITNSSFGGIKTELKEENLSCASETSESFESYSQLVFVCSGPYAETYHSTANCPGLGNCKGAIQYTNELYAVNIMGRRPCCRCWLATYIGCKDDNPTAGGGGGSGGKNNVAGSNGGGNPAGAIVIIAVAAVFITAAILSNDFYVYPTYSFYKKNGNFSDNSKMLNATNNTGWSFGFRKTLKNSAFEYGASLLKSNVEYNDGFGNNYKEEFDRWGGHLNFVHHVFPNKTPKWIKPYIGPSVNYVYDFGYGGIVGAEFKLLSRLKFDLRYEYTTQTNQIQAGLIFKYQKKYFWQKK